jgi:hypothetical protein
MLNEKRNKRTCVHVKILNVQVSTRTVLYKKYLVNAIIIFCLLYTREDLGYRIVTEQVKLWLYQLDICLSPLSFDSNFQITRKPSYHCSGNISIE